MESNSVVEAVETLNATFPALPDRDVSPTSNAALRGPKQPANGGVLALPADWHMREFADAFRSGGPPPWVVEGLVLAESGTIVSAHPHSMKSLSWLFACMEAVAKKKVFGHFPAPGVGGTLFIETEDPYWLVEARIRGFSKGLGLSGKDALPGFHYVCPGPFDLVELKKGLGNLLGFYKPSFAVLSTLQNLLNGRDWRKQEDMQPIMAALMGLARQFCPLILVTHSPWNKKEKRAAGTVTMAANFVISAHYQKLTNRKTCEAFAHVTLDSKAGDVVSNFSLKLETEGDRRDPESVRGIVYAGEGCPRGLAKDAVLAEIALDPNATPKEIADRAGVTARYVQQLMKALSSHGRSQAIST